MQLDYRIMPSSGSICNLFLSQYLLLSIYLSLPLSLLLSCQAPGSPLYLLLTALHRHILSEDCILADFRKGRHCVIKIECVLNRNEWGKRLRVGDPVQYKGITNKRRRGKRRAFDTIYQLKYQYYRTVVFITSGFQHNFCTFLIMFYSNFKKMVIIFTFE